MRKFTAGHLEIRKLDLIEIISLSVFAGIDMGKEYLNFFSYSEMYKFFYDLIFAFLVLAVLSSSFLIRFTNVYFSIGWLALSLLFIIEGDKAISAVALSLFLLYHVVRYFFWQQYNMEFIPPDLTGSSTIDHYSKIEVRSGGPEDRTYVKIFAYTATFILLALLWLSGKRV